MKRSAQMSKPAFLTIAILFAILFTSARLHAQSPFSGSWMGRWASVDGSQQGDIVLIIGPKGEMTGALTNSMNPSLVGQWSGTLLDNGQMWANYAYPGYNQYLSAVGQFGFDPNWQLIGQANFLWTQPGGAQQSIGTGAFQLAFNPDAGTAAAQAAQICIFYPTMCHPPTGPTAQGPFGIPGYPGTTPISPADVLATPLPMGVQTGLDGLPPLVRQAVYPPEVQQMVDSGQVDAGVRTAMGNAQQLIGVINGTGPGGSSYTNQAAIDLLTGNSSIWQLGKALSPYAVPIQYGACKAAGQCP